MYSLPRRGPGSPVDVRFGHLDRLAGHIDKNPQRPSRRRRDDEAIVNAHLPSRQVEARADVHDGNDPPLEVDQTEDDRGRAGKGSQSGRGDNPFHRLQPEGVPRAVEEEGEGMHGAVLVYTSSGEATSASTSLSSSRDLSKSMLPAS
jgi:hypothetical protein